MAKKRISIDMSSGTGTARPVSMPTILPKGKQEKELFIAREFAKVQSVGTYVLADMVSASDDSHGKPDVLATLNGVEIGIQLTELKISHRPASAHRAYKLTEKLLNAVVGRVSPAYPVLVSIGSHNDYSNTSIKLNQKDIQQLAEVVSGAIVNGQYSPSMQEILDNPGSKLKPNPLTIPSRLKKVISRVAISKIPDGHTPYGQGRGNVYVNFNFKTVVASDDTYRDLLRAICQKKQGSNASVLLVWCCDRDFWGEMELIAEMFRGEAGNSSSDHIYLFFFINAEGMFEVNKHVFVIKETG